MIKNCVKCGKEFDAEKKCRICDDCKFGTENSVFHCKLCGKPVSYRNIFCSSSCRSKYNLSQYQPFSDTKVIEKIKQTNIERYGVENVFSSPEIINKIKDTIINNYGSLEAFYAQNKSKIEQTCLERYGVKCNFSSDDPKLNGLDTRIKKYGSSFNLEKAKETIKTKYGDEYEYSSQVPEIKEKIKNTCIERYGSTCYLTSNDGIEKIKQYRLEKYGKPYNNNPEKAAKTRLERINKFGYLKNSQEKLSDEFKKYLYNKDLSIEFLLDNKMTLNQLKDYFNCNSMTPIVNWIKRYDLKNLIKSGFICNRFEIEINSILNKYEFKKDRKILNGLEIDFYSDKLKLGIEFNGTYWHSNIFKDKNYHFNKSKLAEEKGIRLIHIYEYEWLDEKQKEKIISMLNIALNNVKTKIYARNCSVKEISNKEAKEFNNKNHLQGHRNAQVTYGLFYNNELVQLMSFSKTKYNRNLKDENSWEIIRGCPASNNIVIGGVSKLFKHFINDYKPTKVFSYCDFNKFDGSGYEKLGMRFIGYTGPDKLWIIDGKVIKRQPKKYKDLKEKSEAILYGSGSKKYLWEC